MYNLNSNTLSSCNIKIIESKTDLQKLEVIVFGFAVKAKELEIKCTDKRIKQIFHDNYEMMCRIASSIETKKDLDLWQAYKIAVAYDTKYNQPQAFGIIKSDYEFNNKKCSELFALATAYWNIDSPQTSFEAYKVKGAGRAIVKFCSEMGKDFGSRGEVYLQSVGSAEGYYIEKLGFEVIGKGTLTGLTPLFLSERRATKL